uniref:Putative long d7 salivary protein n=1 Tax=Psorophora albipes TaxID=869069 RepID=T1E2U1_9DIPT
MCIAVFLSVQLLPVDSSSIQALNPEQVLFGFSRCGEDFTPNDENRETRIQNWAKWILLPRDNWTMCYVRCCLEKLKLFDVETNNFVTNGIKAQHDAYKQFNGLVDADINEFISALNGLPNQPNCESVFNALTTKLVTFLSTIMRLYHGNSTINKNIYEAEGGKIRQKLQPYTVFCEKNVQSCSVCGFRKSRGAKDQNYCGAMDCIFKGFRYYDENGNIDPQEIIRDFHQINAKQFDETIKDVIAKCNAAKAIDYYRCLRDHADLGGTFQDAFEYREIRSANYDYAFKIPGPPVYSKEEVSAEIDKINKQQGC